MSVRSSANSTTKKSAGMPVSRRTRRRTNRGPDELYREYDRLDAEIRENEQSFAEDVFATDDWCIMVERVTVFKTSGAKVEV